MKTKVTNPLHSWVTDNYKINVQLTDGMTVKETVDEEEDFI